MPPKKSKGTVAKKRPSHGKTKVSKANKSKTKASKRKSQMKKRRDKHTQKQRKERKRADKAKRTAKKTVTKTKKKSKDKKKKKAPPKKQNDPKQQLPSDEEEDGNEEETIEMKFAGLTLNQMQTLRKSVAELSKDEFLDHIKNHSEHRSEEIAFQAAYMTSAENRTKLFYDTERPTDSSAGPFQSNRFGAVFLIPGQQ